MSPGPVFDAPRKAAPALSVVMAVRNGERYLAESIDSLRAQTFRDFELIVVDDGSTDRTGALLAAAARADQRISVMRQEPRGLAASLNRAIELARAPLVARQDADDRSSPARFERQLAYLAGHPDVVALGTGAVAIGDQGEHVAPLTNVVGPAAVRDGLQTLAATPVHGSMMLRRSAVLAVGGYRPAFRAAQDLDLWLRLSEHGVLDNLPDVLYAWRMHAGAVSAGRAEQLLYAGVASALARERSATGSDSYTRLEAASGDLDCFARAYRWRGPLEASWGELLFRGLNDPRAARPYLWSAIMHGQLRGRTLALFVWSLLGRRWPGGATVQAVSARRLTP